MRALRRRVLEYDIGRWADSFLAALDRQTANRDAHYP
jgi:trehalose-6-phosphate synthase